MPLVHNGILNFVVSCHAAAGVDENNKIGKLNLPTVGKNSVDNVLDSI